MALKSNREGLRKESVDYLGNLIITKKLQNDIVENIDSFLKVDLLWENVNPTSSFAPQTVNLDLSGYQRFYLIIKGWLDINYYNSAIIEKNINTYVFASYYSDSDFSSNQLNRRLFFFDDNGFTASNGEVFDDALTPNACIPYKIYGVK